MTYRIFVSSVQREFAKERKDLASYIRKDAILGKFFEVFLFEEVGHGVPVKTLEDEYADKTIIIVSHRRSTLTGCGRILRLRDGALEVCTE